MRIQYIVKEVSEVSKRNLTRNKGKMKRPLGENVLNLYLILLVKINATITFLNRGPKE